MNSAINSMKDNMKHSELRRGNYINTGKSVEQISGLSLQTEPAGSWPVVEIGCCGYYPHNLKPVPITKSWLEKLGFSIEEQWPSGFGSYFYRSDRKIKIGMSNRHGITISLNSSKPCNEIDVYMIDFVHELQNIYQLLTGETI